MKLTTEEKAIIREHIQQWLIDERNGRSANQLAALSGVNIRYIVALRRGDDYIEQDGKQHPIADMYYVKIREIVTGHQDGLHFDSSNFQQIQSACKFAQSTARRVLIDSHDSGAGKTYGLEYYARTTANTLYVKVTSLMKGKDLIDLLADKLSIRYVRRVSNSQRLHDICDKLAKPGYLIILDEMESCSPDLYRVLKDIEDATFRRAGLVISGLGLTQELDIAARKRKKLMPQLWRRFRSNRVMLKGLSRTDVERVCADQGVTDKGAVKVLQSMIFDWAMLSEYMRDIKTLLVAKELPVNESNVQSLFTTES